jgi:hypothetical protein
MSPSSNSPGGRINWVRIGDLSPDMKAEAHHFVALEGAGQDVGIVRQSETGQWLCSMTRVASRPMAPAAAQRHARDPRELIAARVRSGRIMGHGAVLVAWN